MIRTDTLPRLLTACLLTIGLARGAAADFTELEGLLEEPGASLSAALEGDRVVVAVRNGGKPPAEINLLELVNPRLDRLQGIWFFESSGALRSPCEFEARLQVAIEPPPAYSLDMTIERLQGSECFGLGIVVDGHQTMLEIDGDNSTVSGIHYLDLRRGILAADVPLQHFGL